MIKMDSDYFLSKVKCKIIHQSPNKDINEYECGMITYDNGLFFRNKDYICDIKITDNDSHIYIKDKLKHNCTIIAKVTNIIKAKSVISLDVFCMLNNKEFNKLDLTFDKQIQDKLIKNRYIYDYTQTALDRFKNDFMFTNGDGYKDCFIFDVNENSDKKFINIYGKNNLVLNATIENESIVVKNVGRVSQNRPIASLGYGELSFVTNKSIAANKARELLAKNKGYIHSWDVYSNLEGDFLLSKARAIGLIKVESIEIDNSNLVLNLTNYSNVKSIKLLSAGDQLIFTNEPPLYIQFPDLNWVDYREEINSQKQGKKHIKGEKKLENTVTIISLNPATNSITVNNNGKDIENKKFYISYKIDGNEMQIARREEARKSIIDGKSAMPFLGLILNGEDISPDLRNNNLKDLKDLSISNYVKEKIFPNNPPTDNQLLAMEIALNTPDIAIIQGPPGTGKTTVITGFIERLNEVFDKNSIITDMAGQVLVTSFQHDAVENILCRLAVNSLPSIKFGKRSSNSFEEYDMDRIMDIWCSKTSNEIRAKNVKIKTNQLHQKFKNAYDTYRHLPNSNNKLTFLEIAKEISNTSDNLSKEIELIKKIEAMIATLSLDTQDNNEILNAIIRLRTTKQGFDDDGRFQAKKVYNLLLPIIDTSNKNNKNALNILKECFECYDDEALTAILNRIRRVRGYFIDKLTPKPFFIKEVFDSEIAYIYNEINSRITKILDPKLQIISEFEFELENNRLGIQKALEEYSFVYGATTQQCTRIQQKLSSKRSMTTRLTDDYETVIVDEAARANPGDLLIPLNKASKRIILVGDHRQLPHIYNDEIAEVIKENNPDIKLDAFDTTLFEHWFKVAKDMEKKDGIKRVITLNSQFRMHHLLGNFVNDNFYSQEVLGTDESFGSPLGSEFFTQNLFPSPANWIDVPLIKGNEEKGSSSRRRLAEVNIIIEKIKELLATDEGKNLTYGIITFYSWQVIAINNALGEELQDIVRVGTVDAFQGMEFDIIFLSVVRTSKNHNKELSAIDDAYANKLFGFLMKNNRLCVAMSRQKKALVVVGEAKAFNNEISQKYTKALYNYYQLCLENGGVIDG